MNKEETENTKSLHERLDLVLLRLDVIEKKLNDVCQSTNNMDSHISFIDNLYDSIVEPLYYILNKVSFNKISLPVKNKTITN